jgi:hypothetical protein
MIDDGVGDSFLALNEASVIVSTLKIFQKPFVHWRSVILCRFLFPFAYSYVLKVSRRTRMIHYERYPTSAYKYMKLFSIINSVASYMFRPPIVDISMALFLKDYYIGIRNVYKSGVFSIK